MPRFARTYVHNHFKYPKLATVLALLLVSACTGLPNNVKPIDSFITEQYLGTWYEIARLDHSFERGLSNVTADYSLRDDGGIRVINRGFNATTNTWKEAEGKAYKIDNSGSGHLKVSFFGPFYGSYIIFQLNEDKKGHEYAFVSGFNHQYLWLLARTPTVSESVKTQFTQTTREAGFSVDSLIWVEHNL